MLYVKFRRVRWEVKKAGLEPLGNGAPCPSLNSDLVRSWPDTASCAFDRWQHAMPKIPNNPAPINFFFMYI
jgi:hypothetical protein